MQKDRAFLLIYLFFDKLNFNLICPYIKNLYHFFSKR